MVTVTFTVTTQPTGSGGGIILEPGGGRTSGATITPGTPIQGATITGSYVINNLCCQPNTNELDCDRNGVDIYNIPTLVTNANGVAVLDIPQGYPCSIIGQAELAGYGPAMIDWLSSSYLPSNSPFLPSTIAITVYLVPCSSAPCQQGCPDSNAPECAPSCLGTHGFTPGPIQPMEPGAVASGPATPFPCLPTCPSGEFPLPPNIPVPSGFVVDPKNPGCVVPSSKASSGIVTNPTTGNPVGTTSGNTGGAVVATTPSSTTTTPTSSATTAPTSPTSMTPLGMVVVGLGVGGAAALLLGSYLSRRR